MKNSQRPGLLVLEIFIFSLQWILTHQQVNVALGGIATQSSSGTQFFADAAIDGSREAMMPSGSCTHTRWEANPWWRVDLLAVHDISTIMITNRADCCSERTNGAEIHIGDSLANNGNDNPRCAVISSIPAGGTEAFTCNMKGRYVNVISLSAYNALALCEVEVYGIPVTKTTFAKIKINSREDLTDPTIRNNVLQKIKSVFSPTFQVNWKKEPEMETET